MHAGYVLYRALVIDLFVCCPPHSQLADAMELMLLSVLGPAVKCQWELTTAEEAAITSVSHYATSTPIFFINKFFL